MSSGVLFSFCVHWQATLGSTDVAHNKNSFYKLQLLKHDVKNGYYLFRSWGRVGTNIGGSKTEKYGAALDRAKEDFEKLVYFFLRFRCITRIDLDKMPLGRLSKRQIDDAYKVLSELQNVTFSCDTPTDATSDHYLDATNRFYTYVPQNFGMAAPPILNTKEKITEKSKLLDELAEIAIAYSLMKSDFVEDGDATKSQLDLYYEKLHAEMEVSDAFEFAYYDVYNCSCFGNKLLISFSLDCNVEILIKHCLVSLFLTTLSCSSD
ncbi:unnamed protein product [Anisakis simplex]|uniref:NAD(+) ADP-ribosyltransferase n=1 Tax=Anisakis simplex TaxID=6269 RepID=A0A0M3KFI5_ANISI|nr:unnamed protein product [Anisakis simplex]